MFIDARGNHEECNYPTLCTIFIKGLDRQIYTTLAGRTHTEHPNTMEKWYTDVLSLDAIYKGIDQDLGDTTDYRVPMEIDGTTTSHPSYSGKRQWTNGCSLSESEKKHHQDNHLCFYCHNKGHSACECHKKAAAMGPCITPKDPETHPTDFPSYIKSLLADEKRVVMEELVSEDF